jgi:hypothetical protein
MAERISDAELPPAPGKYPWDEWLDGSTWKLTPGEDFTIPAGNMTSQAHQAARTRGGSVRTGIRDGCLLIRFSKDGQP